MSPMPNTMTPVAAFLAFALIFVILVEVLSFAAHRLERRWRIA